MNQFVKRYNGLIEIWQDTSDTSLSNWALISGPKRDEWPCYYNVTSPWWHIVTEWKANPDIWNVTVVDTFTSRIPGPNVMNEFVFVSVPWVQFRYRRAEVKTSGTSWPKTTQMTHRILAHGANELQDACILLWLITKQLWIPYHSKAILSMIIKLCVSYL